MTPAAAHPSILHGISFAAGVAHPLAGLDHIVAMVAVGLWAAIKGNRALWVWPVTFVAVMLIGAALGFAHISLPFVEPGILASVVVLGLMVAFATDPPIWVGVVIISIFALLHGHVHGVEGSSLGGGFEYMAGFALATATLHAVGISLAFTLRRAAASESVNRFVGLICSIVGIGLYVGVL
ncbi:HupE/UreJ family protein [Starkeya sp. ORNL1]|uniref:HupE/UreJ family protein n=1 Tax=Starkeya sp. ORNL1 TaxID=2709380 RepID=UPI001FEFDD77|nr:HupE/UreJ family protein [Starkeya sp. ORNL1]